MNSDLRARFLPRFTTVAAERIERSLALVSKGALGAAAAELHSLSGEAALLELSDIATLAREGEALARSSGAPAECERVLRAIKERIAALQVDSRRPLD